MKWWLKRTGVPVFIPSSSLIGFADEGGDGGDGGEGGDGGGDGGGQTFTQEQVNAFLAKERKKLESKTASELKKIKEEADAKLSELTQQLEDLKDEHEGQGKSGVEKERAKWDKERKRLEDAVAEAHRARDEATNGLVSERTLHRETKVRHQLGQALSQAEVFPQSAAHALQMMMAESELEYDEEGKLLSITLAHEAKKYAPSQLVDAARSYLQEHPWFASGGKGGTGTRRGAGTGNGVPANKPLMEMTSEERLALDAQRRAARR